MEKFGGEKDDDEKFDPESFLEFHDVLEPTTEEQLNFALLSSMGIHNSNPDEFVSREKSSRSEGEDDFAAVGISDFQDILSPIKDALIKNFTSSDEGMQMRQTVEGLVCGSVPLEEVAREAETLMKGNEKLLSPLSDVASELAFNHMFLRQVVLEAMLAQELEAFRENPSAKAYEGVIGIYNSLRNGDYYYHQFFDSALTRYYNQVTTIREQAAQQTQRRERPVEHELRSTAEKDAYGTPRGGVRLSWLEGDDDDDEEEVTGKKRPRGEYEKGVQDTIETNFFASKKDKIDRELQNEIDNTDRVLGAMIRENGWDFSKKK